MLTLILISGCSTQQPLFNRTVFPASYNLSTISETSKHSTPGSYFIVVVNDNIEANNQILKFWSQGWYSTLFKKHHPVLSIKRRDLTNLRYALNRLFKVYYLQPQNKQTTETIYHSSSSIESTLNCKPLTNNEIRFQLNSESENTFPDVPLTLLIISSHELLMQKGAQAEYPRVQSPYLRQRLALPKLYKAPQFNLIATKKRNSVYSEMQMGFVICRNSFVLPK